MRPKPINAWPCTTLALAFTLARLVPPCGWALAQSSMFAPLLRWHPVGVALRALMGMGL